MRGLILGICLASAVIAASAVSAAVLPFAALATLAIGTCLLAFAPELPRWFDPTPRSIFETRRMGLA